MDDRTIRDFIDGGGPGCLPRSDLPTRWCNARSLETAWGQPPIRPDLHSWLAILEYRNHDTEQWAWDGLVALLRALKGCEPPLLRDWACRVVREGRQRPGRSKAEGVMERHDRIRMVYYVLLINGDPSKVARGRIARLANEKDRNIRRITATVRI